MTDSDDEQTAYQTIDQEQGEGVDVYRLEGHEQRMAVNPIFEDDF